MTFKEFKEIHSGGYVLRAAEDIPGFCHKGQALYGDCDDLTVDAYRYNTLTGVYHVHLKGTKRRQYKVINTEQAVTLPDLVFSGDVDGTEIIHVYDPDGKLLVKGEWFSDWILPYTDRKGRVSKTGTGKSISFRLTE